MYQIPASAPQPANIPKLLGLWVAATVVGGLLSQWLINTLIASRTDVDLRVSWLLVATNIATVALRAALQWLVLRQFFARMGGWIPVTVMAYMFGVAVSAGLSFALQTTYSVGLTLILAIQIVPSALLIGLAQTLMLQQSTTGAWVWFWAVAISSVGSLLATIWVVDQRTQSSLLTLFFSALNIVLTGAALVYLVRRRRIAPIPNA